MRLFSLPISLLVIFSIMLASSPTIADVKQGLAALKKRDVDTAFQEFRKSSKAGDIEGTFYLGKAYINGWGVPSDVKYGVELIRDAAESGFAKAEYEMGVAYRYGTGVEINHATAFAWFQRAAKQKDSAAQMIVGYSYRDGVGVAVDAKKAERNFYLAATNSDAKGWMEIGAMYYNGKIVPQDYNYAATMFRAGADQNHPHSVYWLSHLYRSGHGVKASDEKHLEYLTKAANLGSGRAQFEMGRKYIPLFGEKDYVKAVYWLEKATLSRYPGAKEELSFALEDSNWEAPTERSKLFWVKALADNGIAQQQWNYSLMLKEGNKVKKNTELSRKYLMASAKGGFKDAQFSVGQAYFEGSLGLPIDHNKGAELIREAALQHHPEAMKSMAIIYSSGTGVKKDNFVAYLWLLYAKHEGAKDLDGLSKFIFSKLDGGQIATAKKRPIPCSNLKHCTRFLQFVLINTFEFLLFYRKITR